jgi:hypothetical protein
MAQSPRNDRRRQGRGGSTPPPPHKRDPMFYVYAGVGVLVVVIIAIFAGLRVQQNMATKAAYATPSPGPDASVKPIALADGTAIGVKHFDNGKASANTPAGGKGSPVDGIECLSMEGANLHIHTHLALFYNGKQIQVPQYIGIVQNATVPAGCLYWIHTHDASGIIHVESPDLNPPSGGNYTLGMLFDIWGEPLDRNNVAGLNGAVTAYVNGAKFDGDLRTIPLLSHQEITLEVGQPVVPAPHYSWPPLD